MDAIIVTALGLIITAPWVICYRYPKTFLKIHLIILLFAQIALVFVVGYDVGVLVAKGSMTNPSAEMLSTFKEIEVRPRTFYVMSGYGVYIIVLAWLSKHLSEERDAKPKD